MKLTKEQEELASKLNPRQLNFANLWLQKEASGLSDADCYRKAGYDPSTQGATEVQASQLLSLPKVQSYIQSMRRASIKKAGITLEYLDQQLAELLGADIREIMESHEVMLDGPDGEQVRVITPTLKCHIQDMSDGAAACIQEMKMTNTGLQVKTYSRLDAIKTGYQRFGGLIDRKEISGPGGEPIETIHKEMTPEQAAKLYSQEVLGGE